MKLRIAAFAAALLIAGMAGLASAHEVKVGTLTITDLWTRATPPGAPAAGGFLTITNTGTEPDRLIAVSSPETAAGELHEMSMENDVMKMNAVAGGIEIPAGATVKLAPGGLHLMLIGPKGPLTEGGKFPVTITFEKAGKIDTFLHIMPIGSKGPDGAGGGHDHGAMQ
jgi:copper(I)-binding protein